MSVVTVRLGLAMMAGILAASCEEAAPPPAAPPEVYVTNVVQRDVPVYLELVGQTEGFQDVDIRARVEGFLETVNFQEGAFVAKGRHPLPDRPEAAGVDRRRLEGRLWRPLRRGSRRPTTT